MPSRFAQARSQQRRTSILAAAETLLLEAGTAAVTHRRVAAAAQVPLGSIRYYFSTREDLLLAALDHLEAARADAAEQAAARLRPDAPARRLAELFLESFYGPDLSDAALIGYVGVVLDCARESEVLSLRMREHRESMDAQLRALLDAAGRERLSVSLTTAVVDGSLFNAAALRQEGLAQIAVAELTPVLELRA
jgi:DNA-binding transcriptional regulator YbjK